MSENNLSRMIELAKEFFAMDNDPSQISVDDEVKQRLLKIHPCTLSEERNENGPIAWLLIIPTTKQIMQKFIDGEITERELLNQTPFNDEYEAIYLCSALVLPEFRRKGLIKKMSKKAIKEIQKNHPIKYLFYWSFSKEGDNLAKTIAKELELPLLKRKIEDLSVNNR